MKIINALQVALACCFLRGNNASTAIEQQGVVAIGASSHVSVNLHVNFDTTVSSFPSVPDVYAWVRNKNDEAGQFRAQITRTDINGFDVTISRYDTSSGWNWSPELEWEAEVDANVGDSSLDPSTTELFVSRTVFPEPYATVPNVVVWVEGNPENAETFTVNTTRVSVFGFDYTVKNSDPDRVGWSEVPEVYWRAEEPQTFSEASLGDDAAVTTNRIPLPSWLTYPSITEEEENKFLVMGRDILLSAVHRLLKENSQGRFPVTHTESSNMTLEVEVQGDTVYVDEDMVTFQGLKSMIITARRLVGNDGTLALEGPTMCKSIDDNTCKQLGEAKEMTDGMDGKDGVASGTVQINLHEVVGSIHVMTKGSNGSVAEAGGDGTPGQNHTETSPDLSDGESCDRDCGSKLFDDRYYTGHAGPNGGNGGDGGAAGAPGNGGEADAITLRAENLNGMFSSKQEPGFGGEPSRHGLGGRGGFGGTGGCGRACHQWPLCIIWCFPICNTERDCGRRGPNGLPGSTGMNGLQYLPIPSQGDTGKEGEVSLERLKSVKPYFEMETELLKLMRRHGESLFQRNDNQGAYDVFAFLLSVTDANSTLHRAVSLRMDMISEGFDYYGHTENYAPDLSWSYLSERTDDLMKYGQNLEDAYNDILDEIQDINAVSKTVQSIVQIAVSTSESHLANSKLELESAKDLYVRSLQELESTMESEMDQINELIPMAIDEKNKELSVDFGALLGGIVGFVGGLVQLNPVAALGSAMTMVGAMHKSDCDTKAIEEAVPTLPERLDFGYEYEEIDPEDLDFSTMNASAVPAIMLSDLAKNKGLLVQEMGCLYEDPDSEVTKNLSRVTDDYFRDGALRISLMDRIMNIDVQLKEIAFNQDLYAETEATVNTAVTASEESLPMEIKLSFSDFLLNLYQAQENLIMRSMYELSKAYQFESLWNFHALEKYSDFYSDEVLVDGLGQLQGMLELGLIRQQLETERDLFLNLVSSSAGATSHIYDTMWEFNDITNPEVIQELQSQGQFSIKIDLDANDVISTGCANCYNGRLVALYIELSGSDQPNSVPSKVYVQVAHMGDSSFLLPTSDGKKMTQLLQQTPENVNGGSMLSFDSSNPVSSIHDPKLQVLFSKQENKFCEDSNDFFGTKPCKSPYATYVITVPRDANIPCDSEVSGINCQDLDYTRFKKVRVYAKVKSWSDYPVQPDPDTMKSLTEKMQAVKAQYIE